MSDRAKKLAPYVGQIGVVLIGAAVLRLMFEGGSPWPIILVVSFGIVCIGAAILIEEN